MTDRAVRVQSDDLYDLIVFAAIALRADDADVEVPVATLMWMRALFETKAGRTGMQATRHYIKQIDGLVAGNGGKNGD